MVTIEPQTESKMWGFNCYYCGVWCVWAWLQGEIT